MRNLVSYNPSFIWTNKLQDRNRCINDFNNFYLNAKKQDRFYIKQDLLETANSIIREFANFRPYNDLKVIFPWLTPDSFNILSATLLQIKNTQIISEVLSTYDSNHEFTHSSWMGICESNTLNYAYDSNSWKQIHMLFVMDYTRDQRLQYREYFSNFCKGHLKVQVRDIKRKIRSGSYKHFERIDIPAETAGLAIHGQQIHIHLKNDGALNIDGSVKHPIRNLPVAAAEDFVEIGFILPENL